MKYIFDYEKDSLISLFNKIIKEQDIDQPFLVVSRLYSSFVENLKEYDTKSGMINNRIIVEYLDMFEPHFTLNGNEIEVVNFV